MLDKEGKSDFDALHSHKHDKQALFYAFDILAGEGEDLRRLALARRKAKLARLLSDPVDGIFIVEYEQGESATFYSASPATWLRGIISKRLDRA